MRLWDKVVQEGQHQASPLPTVFCVDNIARAYAQNERKQLYDLKDFQFARPPWDYCFVEWITPKWFWSDGALRPCHPASPKQIGFEVTTITDPVKVQHSIKMVMDIPESRFAGSGKPDISKATTGLLVRPVIDVNGQLIFPEANGTIWLDESATPVGEMFYGPDLDAGGMRAKLVQDHLGDYFGVVLLAFSFANVKNVPTVDVTELVQPPARIRRRLRLPDVRRVTIEITPGETKPYYKWSDQPDAMPDECGVAAHIVRGHFAEYTPERPRFGRPGEFGRYWISSHVRGKKEHGEVIKDHYVAGEPEPEVANA